MKINLTYFKLCVVFAVLLTGGRGCCQPAGVRCLPYGWARPHELSPQLSGVYSYSDTTIFSGCLACSLARSRVLDAERENPISAVTFCLCSGNIQGPYIKGRRGARQRGGSFNDGGGAEIMPSLVEGLFQVIISGLNPATRQAHCNSGAAGINAHSAAVSHRRGTLILIGVPARQMF